MDKTVILLVCLLCTLVEVAVSDEDDVKKDKIEGESDLETAATGKLLDIGSLFNKNPSTGYGRPYSGGGSYYPSYAGGGNYPTTGGGYYPSTWSSSYPSTGYRPQGWYGGGSTGGVYGGGGYGGGYYPQTGGGYYPSTNRYYPSVGTNILGSGGYGGGYGGYGGSGYGGGGYTGGGYGAGGYGASGYGAGGYGAGGYGAGGYGGYGGNGGLQSYYGYHDSNYVGNRNLGYGYYGGTNRFGLDRTSYSTQPTHVSGYRGYE